MKSKFHIKFFYAALPALLLLACNQGATPTQQRLGSLKVNWKMLANNTDETSNAAFTFTNTGNTEIDNRNWALYFNQNTLRMHHMPDSLKGRVEHVNGDLYRFFPGSEFSVKPGESITINYTYKGFLIKESDAPNGAYFVVNPGQENEEVVIPNAFVVAPFDNLQEIFPLPEILETIPTAANQYTKNQAITPLPRKSMGKIIPTPASWVELPGKLKIDDATAIAYQAGLEHEASFLAQSIEKLFNIKLVVHQGPANGTNTIELRQTGASINGGSAESYKLSITKNSGIQITGSDAAGVFYGAQSLLSVLWSDKDSAGVFAECAEISDAPRFSYRGFLLDVSRNFQQKKDVFRLIDLLSSYKINKLNIRITEDEGWRIEIKGLPELTQVGGKRGHTRDSKNWLSPSFGSGPNPNAEKSFGNGYYTREDFKDILRYAQKHHIQVIPEVCLPSHSRAAIKAMEARYDFYMAKNEPAKAKEFRLIDPNDKSVYLSAQMYKDNIVNVALPSVYHFYETVVKDFKAMYEEAGLTLKVFNTGGDEVPNGAWARSPISQELMKSLPEIKDARQLQGYFLEKAMAIFEKYDLQVTGWEEIVLNKDSANNISVNTTFVGRNILPLVWDNTGDNIDLGYRIANAGYPVVLCNVTNLYFDLAYNPDPKEPGLYWGGFQDAIDPYVMAPFDVYKTAGIERYRWLGSSDANHTGKVTLAPDKRKNIVGLSAQLWSETIKGAGMMEYYVVPKIFAFAEKAWAQAPAWESESNATARNKAISAGWNVLANRIGQYELPKIDAWFGDYHYRIAAPGGIIKNGMLYINTEFPGLILRYTTDGTDPSLESKIYTGPVAVSGSVKVRAFNQKGRGGSVFNVK